MNFRPLRSILALLPLSLWANNIQVSNVTLTGQNTTTDTWQVQFDLSWENSWRTSSGESNYDAAWVFIKYRFGPNLDWRHATLSPTGHVASSGSIIAPPGDLKGAFIHRSVNGIGNVNFTSTQLQWSYAGTGISDNDPIELRVLAIEMVFVPQGSFALGDGTTTSIAGQFELGQTAGPFIVTSEDAIILGGAGATSLNTRNSTGLSVPDDFNYTVTQTLPAGYPKGFNAFYAMKYEASEGQYVDFLNLLTASQAATHFPNQTGSLGHTIDDTGVAPNIYVTSAPERACGTGLGSLAAYADWAALRPMSELEYEKLCRGTLPAVANEYSWGSITLSASTATLGSSGTANEVVTNPGAGGLANYLVANTGNQRPWRVAAIPASIASPTRVQASAAFYGANELTGNLSENCVSAGSVPARAFLGSHMGDGALTAIGATDITNWISVNVTSGSIRQRGGNFSIGIGTLMRLSHRNFTTSGNVFSPFAGIRLCRLP